MVNLRKGNKKEVDSERMPVQDTIAVAISIVIATICLVYITFIYCERTRIDNSSELAAKINNAYQSNYDIFINGISVQQIPNEVLEHYGWYDFLFDDVGGTVIISKRQEEYWVEP